MYVKVGHVFVLLLVGNWGCDARPLTNSDLSGYANLAVENKTQIEITEALDDACSEFHTLREQRDELCIKANLCQGKRILFLPEKENSCDICHHAVDEIIVKLKDPDTQLEILEILLKGCNAANKYVKKCKAMVFEYGPFIISNAQQYLEKTDVCATFHACSSPAQLDAKILMVTSP